MNKPNENETCNFTALHEAVNDYLEYLASDEYHSDSVGKCKNDIFEKAVETFYPAEIWDWVNETQE